MSGASSRSASTTSVRGLKTSSSGLRVSGGEQERVEPLVERVRGGLRDLVRNYLGDELRWTVNLVLEREAVPAAVLGVAGELGWTTWLGRRRAVTDADDVVVDPFFQAH